MSETNTEKVEETGTETFTKEDVEKMISEATSKANNEAASFRHKLKEIETEKEEAERKRMEEQGEFKEIAEQRTKELEELKGLVESKDEVLNTYKERDEKELSELIAKVPESLRDEISNESLPLSTRLSLARKLSNTKPTPPGDRPSGESNDKAISRQSFEAMSPADKSKHIREGGIVTD
jgi:uncharacterized protein YydD (DUF2326 family)